MADINKMRLELDNYGSEQEVIEDQGAVLVWYNSVSETKDFLNNIVLNNIGDEYPILKFTYEEIPSQGYRYKGRAEQAQ